MDFLVMDFYKKKLLCLSLTDSLKRFVDGSIEVYISKASNRMHLTARRSLLDDINNVNRIFQRQIFNGLWFYDT